MINSSPQKARIAQTRGLSAGTRRISLTKTPWLSLTAISGWNQIKKTGIKPTLAHIHVTTVNILEKEVGPMDEEEISQEEELESTNELDKMLEVSRVDFETAPEESGEDKEE
jgi:hypothetical protein